MTDVAVAFGRDMDLSEVADTELLTQLKWMDSAPADLRQFAQGNRIDKFWRAWSTRNASREIGRAHV